MKYIASIGPKKSEIRELPKPLCREHEILIRLLYVGVCRSEHHSWSVGDLTARLGHEPLGVVEMVGDQVTGFQVGDKVSGLWGSSIEGVGGMVEYVAIDPLLPSNIVLRLPKGPRDVDLILEPLSCLMSAVSKAKIAMPGTEVCVVGAGYMGCGAISLLKLRGAIVTAVDTLESSLLDAKRFGADTVYTVDQAKAKLADGSLQPFEVVMEWGENADAVNLAIELTAFCGQLCIGGYHTGGPRLIDMQQLNMKAIECLSVHPREIHLSKTGAENALKLISTGRWNFTDVPTKVYPMSQFDLAHSELDSKYGKYMKAVIDMTMVSGEAIIIE